eukprot:TRINITY_DN3145_c0_g2_i4.p1 TRINITY_DN3145_c0_g2~~TRINITY_DN3145_c0_g2_i4.p1  ORF type:complete len:268 (-),score=32.74 TRINITY_DN3145_c0_g2_i4:78-881(-)
MGSVPSTLIELPAQISSLAFNPSGKMLASWSPAGNAYLIDTPKGTLSTFSHTANKEQGIIVWRNEAVFSTALASGKVLDYDTRQRSSTRTVEVKASLASVGWSCDGSVLCGGTSDGKVILWDARRRAALHKFSGHRGMVKGLAWSSSLLASGCTEGKVKMWDVQIGKCSKEIDTAPVWSLLFSRNTSEIISGHGDPLNAVTIWNMDGNKEGNLLGHQMKVTQLALSPLGNQLLTGAGDETLRFWEAFPSNEKKKGESLMELSSIKIR